MNTYFLNIFVFVFYDFQKTIAIFSIEKIEVQVFPVYWCVVQVHLSTMISRISVFKVKFDRLRRKFTVYFSVFSQVFSITSKTVKYFSVFINSKCNPCKAFYQKHFLKDNFETSLLPQHAFSKKKKKSIDP